MTTLKPPFAALVLVLVGVAGGQVANAADDYNRQANDLRAKFTVQFEQLASWCDQRGLKVQAETTRHWIGHRDPNKLYIAELPREIGHPALPSGTPPDAVEWDSKFMQIRQQYADGLLDLARRAVRAGRASLAMELALAAIGENPDHEGLRRILGFQKYSGGWYTAYEVERLRKKMVWNDKFGWLPQNHAAQYESDKRFYRPSQRNAKGKWIAADEDARLHDSIESGWEIETEHYRIRTNHSLEAGVALGTKLEQLYRVWKELFVRYFASQAEVQALFGGQARRVPAAKHKIVYFRSREDYMGALKLDSAAMGKSTGVYVDADRCAYFFADKDSAERTLLHEATHQLFHETRNVARDVGARANFWIVEGVAMYMETLRRENGFFVLGGFEDVRIQAAQYHIFKEDFYIPIAEFSQMGMLRLQNDPRIRTLYSEAAGLTLFLMHYDGGRYRDALVACLDAIYSGRDNPMSLAQLTQTPSNELDAQYRQFMKTAGQPPAEKKAGVALPVEKKHAAGSVKP